MSEQKEIEKDINLDIFDTEKLIEEARSFLPVGTYEQINTFFQEYLARLENLDKEQVFLEMSSDMKKTALELMCSKAYTKLTPYNVYAHRSLSIEALNTFEGTFKQLKPKSPDERKALTADFILQDTLDIAPVYIDLPHSGFHLIVEELNDSDVITLQENIHQYEISLGRDTAGLVYSNAGVIHMEIIVDAILAKTRGTSLEASAYKNKSELKKHIDSRDYDMIILGVYKKLSRKGKTLFINCVNMFEHKTDEDGKVIEPKKPKCTKLLELHTDLESLYHLDESLLSSDMITQLNSRDRNSITLEQVKKYKEEINNIPKTTSFKYKKITTHFKNVSLHTKIKDGSEWIESVMKDTATLFTEELNPTAKQALLVSKSNASFLCNFKEFVSHITIEGSDEIMEDRKQIAKTLTGLSSDKNYTKSFIDAYKEFIGTGNVAFIGIPTYVCDVCKKDQKDDFVPELRTINMVSVFLDLLTDITDEILKRDELPIY